MQLLLDRFMSSIKYKPVIVSKSKDRTIHISYGYWTIILFPPDQGVTNGRVYEYFIRLWPRHWGHKRKNDVRNLDLICYSILNKYFRHCIIVVWERGKNEERLIISDEEIVSRIINYVLTILEAMPKQKNNLVRRYEKQLRLYLKTKMKVIP